MKVEGVHHHPESRGSIFKPLSCPDREALAEGIPIGSDVLIVSWDFESYTPDVRAVHWDEEYREQALSSMKDGEQVAAFFVYVPPEDLPSWHHASPRGGSMLSVDEIVSRSLDELNAQDGNPSAHEFHSRIAFLARLGMVPKPF